MVDLERYRDEFPICKSCVYLNHAGVAPASLRVRDAVVRWLDRYCERVVLDEDVWEDEVERCRGRLARLIGARADEIAFVRNTSHGLSLVAEGIDWQAGDRVAAATELEYPSNVYPWLHLQSRGVVVDPIAAPSGTVTVEEAERVLQPRTRLLSVSSAQFATGAVTHLDELGSLCRERGVMFCVDGIQTVGALPTDVERSNIDFLPADSHKWLLGLVGIGALYVRRELVEGLRPALVGWKSTTDGWNFDRTHFELLPDARRFEEGSPAYPMIAGLDAALELLEEVGIEVVAERISALVEQAASGLEALGAEVMPPPGERRNILTFTHRGCSGERLLEGLTERGFVVSLRRGRLRVSPHFYNTAEEIDRLVAACAELVAGQGPGREAARSPET